VFTTVHGSETEQLRGLDAGGDGLHGEADEPPVALEKSAAGGSMNARGLPDRRRIVQGGLLGALLVLIVLNRWFGCAAAPVSTRAARPWNASIGAGGRDRSARGSDDRLGRLPTHSLSTHSSNRSARVPERAVRQLAQWRSSHVVGQAGGGTNSTSARCGKRLECARFLRRRCHADDVARLTR